MEVYGMKKDLAAFSRLLTDRQSYIDNAASDQQKMDPMNALAQALHPERLNLVITEVRDEMPDARTFRLAAASSPSGLPFFRAGQYLSVKLQIGDSWITRPYSISSAPSDAAAPEAGKQGFYELTIRRKEGGFLTSHVWQVWRQGITMEASGPHGTFYHDPLRDTRDVIAIAGGSGITPIRAMIREMAAGSLNIAVTLFYGIRRPDEMLFAKEMDDLSARFPDKLRVIHVCSEPDPSWSGPAGFITADCIRQHIGNPEGKTFLLCGPVEMYRFLDHELSVLKIPRRRIRRELFGEEANIAAVSGFPKEAIGKSFTMNTRIGLQTAAIPARSDETILVSLERAGLGPDAQCRSGECGFCRSRLLSGDVFVKPDNDGRRAADKKFGFIHPCATYPLSDLDIEVPLTGAALRPTAKAASFKESHFDASYNAIVIGAGNGGLAAALKLSLEGAKVLLLEQHNLPGGFATSFVRGRFEFEPSLHELSNVGSPQDPGFVRKFYREEAGVDVEFHPVPEAYHLILTGKGINVRIPFGIDNFIETVERNVPGSREALEKYMAVCKEVFDAIGYISRLKGAPDGQVLMDKYPSFLTTAGYSVDDVTRTFGFSQEALDLIYPYWCYLGLPVNRLSFTIWALVLHDYFLRGAHIPQFRSHGMSAAIDARIRQLGGHMAYSTKVVRILVEDGKVTGVETEAGDRIAASWVISNASPNLVYNRLIPQSAVPERAFKLTNARKIGASAFVVYLGLDASPDELGIDSYGYFIGENMDTEKAYGNFFALEELGMQAAICLNRADANCSPPGTTILSLTVLAGPDAWQNVSPRDYVKTKERFARVMIDQFSAALGTRISDHIEEIEIAAPPTFARYTGVYKGSIYAYEQDPWDSVVARTLAAPQERFIKGLEFTGGYALMGCGYEATILSGRTSALQVLSRLKKGY